MQPLLLLLLLLYVYLLQDCMHRNPVSRAQYERMKQKQKKLNEKERFARLAGLTVFVFFFNFILATTPNRRKPYAVGWLDRIAPIATGVCIS